MEREKNTEPGSFKIDSESREYLLGQTKRAFEVAKTLTHKQTPVFLYGGTIRNLLLGIETSIPDYDFIGDFDLDQIEHDFPGLIIGRWDSVSTIRLKVGAGIYDFTAAKNIEERLAQNDITTSNLCISESGELFDYFGALESLAKREIKMLDPKSKMQSNPNRILRAFRFATELGFTIEEATLVAAIKYAPLLKDSTDLDEDLWQIVTLDDDKRIEVLRLLHQYGIDRYLTFPDNVLEAINVHELEREIQRHPQVEEVARMFNTDIYLVGGAVRDFIWGKKITDLDFKVHLPISEMIRILEENGFERCEDYHISGHQYYVSAFAGVVGAVIDGVDVHLAGITTTDLPTLIKEGDINFSCCVYNANTRRIENPGTIKDILDKTLLFCDPERAKSDSIIILNALKQISRIPDIIIPQETKDVIETSIPLVVQFIKDNPDFRYKLEALCGNLNSEQVYEFFGVENQSIFDGMAKKKTKLEVSSPGFTSVALVELDEYDRAEIIELIRSGYGKHFDSSKVFTPNISSVVFERRNGKIVACCTVDGERPYSVAAREGVDWAGVLAELVRNNYSVWGTVDCNNPKIQALCSIAGMSIETNPEVIRKILATKTDKYMDVEIFEYNGMVVFRKRDKKDDYPQVLVRA